MDLKEMERDLEADMHRFYRGLCLAVMVICTIALVVLAARLPGLDREVQKTKQLADEAAYKCYWMVQDE